MCGIFCHVSSHDHVELDPEDAKNLNKRGPDASREYKTIALAGSNSWYLTFTSSVLALRGDRVHFQPVIDDVSGSVFCWNGEAWSFDGSRITDNDTETISRHIFHAVGKPCIVEEALLSVLRKIAGPYAFVFYDARRRKLFFGRDSVGRRSLTISHDTSDSDELTVSSIAIGTSVSVTHEVETPMIYTVDLNQPRLAVNTLTPIAQLPRINNVLPESGFSLHELPATDTVHLLIEQLKDALLHRIEHIPTYTAYGQGENPSRVAVLFSGGLDCTLLARLMNDLLPYDQPVDLLNVAFENPRVLNARAVKLSTTTIDTYESCPDRMTGRSSFRELTIICPQREWRFLAIDVPYQEFLEHRPTIVHLMHPHDTEMDLSISAALYFAARGQGTMHSSARCSVKAEPYTTTARVLLSGLGADEVFGGYARHAAAFARGGFRALNIELELDFTRLGKRNLGRDDRVIAHWGRETRYPFLDEKFTEFALGLPAWEKCGFRPGKAIPKHFENTMAPERPDDLHPEKMLLRLAMWELGMKGAAAEKKRAIQFGARTAKMHGGRTKGTDLVSAMSDGTIGT